MGKKPRGRVLVINNKIFFGPLEEDQFGRKRVILPTREGTEQDQRKIEEVFKQLNFTVDVFQDKKGEVRKTSLQILENTTYLYTNDFYVCTYTCTTTCNRLKLNGEQI